MKNFFVYRGVSLLLMLCISCYFGCCKGCLDDERRALQQIRESMGYQSDPVLSTDISEDCCQWEEVACSLTSSHVVGINFEYIREEEKEPWYPDMNLFAQLKELQELHLKQNQIGGLLNPDALCKLTNLQQLDLSCNSIEDLVQSCWGNMPSLKILNLSKNRFQGNFTSIFGNLSTIEVFDVYYNLFQGLVPFSIFANLSKLSHLDLSYNYQLEIETESPTWHPSFQIQYLFLAGCNLNRQSHHVIPSFIFTQDNLQSIDLSSNGLIGSFPTWMFHNVSSVLRLRSNSFVGQFPQPFKNMVSTLVELDISGNYFDGNLPSNINTFLPKLYGFNASSNLFNGSIPQSLGELQNLQHLDLSNNYFSGVIPSGLTENSPLWYLNLSNNSLSGELLPKDCNMKKLKWLLLHNNQFIGNMPSCLSNSPVLMMLDVRYNNLSGTILSQLPVFSQLGALLVRANRFGGFLPRKLCQMSKLQFLDLSNNYFSGNIPSCLKNNFFWREKQQANSWVPIDFTTKGNTYSYQGIPLTLMTGIDLSVNQLTGNIPVEIGELQELHSLNLSHNHFTGHFPTSFKNLMNMESLDLSYNQLTGPIPTEICRISSLTTFSVAFNDLSGRIPFDQQLSTFSESSFMGNPKLCGQPLERECSAKTNQDDEDDDDDGGDEETHKENEVVDEPLFFYAFVFMSYTLGFWSVIAPLCISRKWRRIYFAAIEGGSVIALRSFDAYLVLNVLFTLNPNS